MKKYFAFIICLLMTANLFSQEKYPVPGRTYEQKFNRAMYIQWYLLGLSARIAKEDGKNLYETGRRAGDPPFLVADGSLANETLNWKPRLSDLETIVSTAWKWHEKVKKEKIDK